MFEGWRFNFAESAFLIFSHSYTSTLITVFSMNMSGFCYFMALLRLSFSKSNLNRAISRSTLYASKSRESAFFRLFDWA